MLVFEFKTYGKSSQFTAVDEAIRTAQFVKNSCLRSDGVYVKFCIDVDRKENTEPSGNTIGLDVGLKEYYTDSNGVMVENPKFLKKGEKVLKRCHRRISRKVKGSKNRSSSRQVLGKRHLKISRQRKDHQKNGFETPSF